MDACVYVQCGHCKYILCTVVCMYVAKELIRSHVHVYSYVVVVVVVVIHTHQVSPDHDLILDTHPTHPTIIFGTGFSGICTCCDHTSPFCI